ncbi:glycosyltransferase [Oceanicella sp. SM1341]|uniref:glycosyltransferase family 2 protein n=1 Tax=Oceanicella sp. SM1341 TaxID=1548889 RepID=UPI000E46AA38|nr:glycosyltransferase [Oceanicella sp. SM1341]
MVSESPVPAAGFASARAQSEAERFGAYLASRGLIDPGLLARALARQRRSRRPLGEVLVAHGQLSRRDMVRALGAFHGIMEVDLAAAPADPALLARCSAAACLDAGCIPWRRVGSTVIVVLADPTPERLREAEQACGLTPGTAAVALADRQEIEAALALAFRDHLALRAGRRTREELSCRSWGRHTRTVAAAGVALALLCFALFGIAPCLAVIFCLAVLSNAATTALRLTSLVMSWVIEDRAPPHELPRLSRFRTLPQVSILVPLFRETEVLDRLLAALGRLDYPAELLDIILVLEEDDTRMVEAVQARSLPPTCRALTVPADSLRTKPRAMNYALDFCRGEILGIYDAEDQPDPKQVATVVEAFAESPARVACIQARLSYFNAGENWISRCFAVEYATWFNVLLKGVQRVRFPVPLGGTSVFFRRSALEAVGAWDAHNVTEDADLGMRLARFGLRTRVIDSITLEEANCRAWPWVKQRSRWQKGYMVTWITHMLQPLQLWRDLGVYGFIGFQVLMLGGAAAQLSLPLLWLGWLMSSLGFVPSWIAAVPAPLMPAIAVSLLVGQVVLFATSIRALVNTGQARLIPWLAILPLYWPLGAAAAYKALFELVFKPFYWDKTDHGVSVVDPYGGQPLPGFRPADHPGIGPEEAVVVEEAAHAARVVARA